MCSESFQRGFDNAKEALSCHETPTVFITKFYSDLENGLIDSDINKDDFKTGAIKAYSESNMYTKIQVTNAFNTLETLIGKR